MTDPRRRSLGRVFRMPALLAASSVVGLAASLVGDGAWDWLGAGGLLLPAGVALARLAPRPRARAGWDRAGYPARRRSFS